MYPFRFVPGAVRQQAFRFVYRRRGVVMFQAAAGLMMILFVCSLGVDIGTYYLARSELQRSADAAALAAAAVAKDGLAVATTEAIEFASSNSVVAATLPNAAITCELGRWEAGVFTPGGLNPDSVRVRVRRSTTLNNALELPFSRMVGLPQVDLAATAVARMNPKVSPYNFVGIESATFSSLGVLAEIKGRIVSNGDVNIGRPLGLLVRVDGDARSYEGQTRKGILAAITNSTLPLQEELVYPSVTLPPQNDNERIASYLDGSGDFNCLLAANIPAGTYVVRDLNMLAGLMVNLQGPVTFYVKRNFNLAASINLLGSTGFSASQFRIRVLPGGNVNFLAPLLVPMNMDLYAPDSDIVVGIPVTQFRGRLIGRRLDILLPALGRFVEEQDLENPLKGLPALTLVE